MTVLVFPLVEIFVLDLRRSDFLMVSGSNPDVRRMRTGDPGE